MTAAAVAALMTTTEGAPIPLTAVAVRATLRDLLAEVAVEHRYRNQEAAPIEAVYSFPLPPEAVLLDVQVRLGERTLSGRVVARQAAEQAYEEAIVEGDAAVMIERPEPGLYVMNLGNLLPQVEAVVTFRYALVLRRQRGRIRFLHPTTIAPRYGRWALEPHQVPEATLFAEQQGMLEIEVLGALAGATFVSPSHAIDIEPGLGRAVVRLRRGAMHLDRDFVLEVDAGALPEASALLGADIDGGHACLLALEPRLPLEAEAAPRDLKIVVDCSGSMQGDSIAQARAAVAGIVERLRSQDRFTVVLFGSTHRLLFPTMVPGDDATVAQARRLLDGATADMGGTEMGAALTAAYRVPVRKDVVPTIILITDGEITDVAKVVQAARASGHRLFTVGVGSAVAEGLLRDLARATGGACELVAPREDMAERIVRHFRRIDGGGARLAIDWPAPPIAEFDLEQPVFAGDTAVVFARFAERPQGGARVAFTLPTGQRCESRVTMPAESEAGLSTVARLAAARELFALGVALDAAPKGRREELETKTRTCAERYQLLSPWTSWLLVVAQANAQAGEIPAIRKVPHMLAAGWGGVGFADLALSGPMPARAAPAAAVRSLFQRAEAPPPAWFGQEAKRPGRETRSRGPLADFINLLDGDAAKRGRRLGKFLGVMPPVPTVMIDDLLLIEGIDAAVIAELRRLVTEGHDEPAVVAAFLRLLIDAPMGQSFGRRGRLLVRRLHRDLAPAPAVTEAVRRAAAAHLATAP
jgi:Ca-activated chloride channel family protein